MVQEIINSSNSIIINNNSNLDNNEISSALFKEGVESLAVLTAMIGIMIETIKEVTEDQIVTNKFKMLTDSHWSRLETPKISILLMSRHK